MAEKKKPIAQFTHWARPRVRTYEYNYEVGESYYRPMVSYISTSRASSQLTSVSTKQTRYAARRNRAESPPGALSFIERWTNEPFYGYGVGFQTKKSSSSLQSSSSRISSEMQSQSLQRQSSSLTSSSSTDIRQRRARSVEAAARYASDDCLMRSSALNSASAASQQILNTSSLTRKTLALDSQNVLHGKTLDERHYLDYPKQHLVCPDNCPLHNSPEWRRRFLIGNRFLDAAALGGFDVLYDPTVFNNSRRLLKKLAESRESETEEIVIQRSSESESSRRRLHATIY